MIKGAAGRRYARAIFDLAISKDDYDTWLADLKDIRDFMRQPEVAQIVQNPEVPFEQKRKVIDAGLPALGTLPKNFVYVLVSKRRTELIDSIVDEFERLTNEQRGVAIAEVTTAVPLDEDMARTVAERLAALSGKKIVLRLSVDPAIIGGLVARVGDKLINASVAERLASLRTRLAQA
ncbi:MAG: ATP synthase F1 subunit delta [Chloroflexi bacterium]|nr:ATP synthase F1 subunit delta [Chloroflexota bacterium]